MMKLHEEFKLFENMWDSAILHETKVGLPAPEEYFKQITSSLENAVTFIKEKLAPYINAKQVDTHNAYSRVLAKETLAYPEDIRKNSAVNYKAFTTKMAEYGLNSRKILTLIRTGTLTLSEIPTSAKSSNDAIDVEADIFKQNNSSSEADSWSPAGHEISQETIDMFHKQNIRILQLLARYTDIHRQHKADLNDLLKQLDENRLKNPYQAERDFQGI